MRRLCCLVVCIVLLLAPAADAGIEGPKTFFDYVARAWAVAHVQPTNMLEYRDGQLLGFPSELSNVAYARVGVPRGAFLVYEKVSPDDKPPLAKGEGFFAPLMVLPKYSYWRDNLPHTPHHAVLGGRRYIFRGDDEKVADALVRRYAATFKLKGKQRRIAGAAVVVDALFSPVQVLAEDAVRHLRQNPVELSILDEAARSRLSDFLLGDHPAPARRQLIEASAAAGVGALVPVFEQLADKHDAVAASALLALQYLDHPRSTEHLRDRLDDDCEEVRSYAARTLGARGAKDEDARKAAIALLTRKGEATVRTAAATGLGESGDPQNIAALRSALARSDEASRAAAKALARIGTDDAVAALEASVLHGKSEEMTSAVLALGEIRASCGACWEFLRQQHDKHPEKAIRDLIEIVLELEHKHLH